MQSNNPEDFLFLIKSQFKNTMQDDLDWTDQMKNVSKLHSLNICFLKLLSPISLILSSQDSYVVAMCMTTKTGQVPY